MQPTCTSLLFGSELKLRQVAATHLALPILVKDGDLLHKAVRGEHRVERLHIHRVCLVLDLHVHRTPQTSRKEVERENR